MALIGLAGPAAAQSTIRSEIFNQDIPDDSSRGRNIGVLDRDHPEYDGLGVPLGSFTAYPSLAVGGGYETNIFGTKADKVGDGYAQVDPQLTAGSNWSRNAVGASLGADIKEFFSHGDENEQGWHALVDGRYDLGDKDAVYAGFNAQKLYEEQDSGFYPIGAAAPLGYIDTDAFAREEHKVNRIRLVVSADYHTFTYDNVAAVGGGTLSQSFNNHNDWRVTGLAEYALTPDTAVFAEVSHLKNTYTDTTPNGGQDLDGDENRYLMGINADLPVLVRGSVGVGYVQRSYDDPAFQGVSGLALDVHLQYFPTTLLTLSGSVKRTVEDSIDFDNAGFVSTNSQVRADYELLRDLLLNAEVAYENDAYRTVARNDDITTFGGGATYNLNRNTALHGYASHTNRASTGALLGPTFTETRFLLTLILKL